MKRMLAIILALSMILSSLNAAIAEEAAAVSQSSQQASTSQPGGNRPPEKPGETSGQPAGGVSLEDLVQSGVISQETMDAIVAYMKKNQPADLPQKPDGVPEPAGENANAPEDGMMIHQEVLSQLLENGLLTQTEYDVMAELLSQQADAGAASSMGTPPDGQFGQGGNLSAGGPGAAAQSVSYTAAIEISEAAVLTDENYASDTADENALLVSAAQEVQLVNPTVTKTGNSDGGDSCSFYGMNAAVLAKDGAEVTIQGGTITSEANGANGVFSYGGNGGQNGAAGDGTTVNISDTSILTTGDNAGGIMTTGGGVTNASNLTSQTFGRSSAAIRTDRGGGTVTVDGGSYTTSGLGSPAIYSTANVSVRHATLVSNLSEGVCIEGKNTVTLTDCDLTVDNTQCNGNATFLDSIMIYQSMSGDADSDTSVFNMSGGSITSKSGHVFHVTNTHAVITLENVTITNEDQSNVLHSVCGDGWNGGNNQAELQASAQILEGSVLVGSNAFLTLTLANGSDFIGSISGVITNSRGETISTETGNVAVTMDAASQWSLTADSYVTSFFGNAGQVISNGYTLYVNGVALEGIK